MKFLLKGYQLLVFSNIWISFTAGALVHVTYKVFNLSEDIGIVLFAITSTFVSYNFQRVVRLEKESHLHLMQQNWVIQNKMLIYVLLLITSLLSILFLWPYLSLHLLELLFVLAVLSLFYAIPIKGLKGLRNLPYLKLYLIALSWVGLGVVLPFVVHHRFLIVNWNFAGQVFLFFLAITIPFDIRDMELDTQITIPRKFGWRNAKRISLFMMLVVLVWNFLTFNYLFLSLTYIITFILLLPIHLKTKELYYSGVLDGTIFLFLINYLFVGTIQTFS